MDIRKIESVHFIAIGGSVMHNLALALKKMGMRISGSDDEIYEPAAGKLKSGGIEANIGWQPEKMDASIDLVVLGMHAKADNPELAKAKSLKLPIVSFPDFIRRWSANQQRIVIGGSHGKSSITALAMHVLNQLNKKFDYLIGAEVEGFSLTVSLSDAPIIIIEGDEYLASKLDPVAKFLKYDHHIGLISGIAWDHKNVFPSFEDYTQQFEQFADKTPKAGSIIYNEKDLLAKKIGEKEREDVRKVPYGVHDAVIKNGVTYLKTKDYGEVKISVFGDHNLENIGAVLALVKLLGIEEKAFYQAVQTFTGAKKRLEIVKQQGNDKLFKDYAHSPSKLEATTTALKKQFADSKVVVAYELHTFSSLNKEFIKEYKNTLSKADEAFIFINPHNIKNSHTDDLTTTEIQEAFNNTELTLFTDKHKLVEAMKKAKTTEKNIFALLSSGNFDGLDIEEVSHKLIA